MKTQPNNKLSICDIPSPKTTSSNSDWTTLIFPIYCFSLPKSSNYEITGFQSAMNHDQLFFATSSNTPGRQYQSSGPCAPINRGIPLSNLPPPTPICGGAAPASRGCEMRGGRRRTLQSLHDFMKWGRLARSSSHLLCAGSRECFGERRLGWLARRPHAASRVAGKYLPRIVLWRERRLLGILLWVSEINFILFDFSLLNSTLKFPNCWILKSLYWTENYLIWKFTHIEDFLKMLRKCRM